MKAEDTVMNEGEIGQAIKEAVSKQGWLDITIKQRYEAIAQAQAEISFKAGKDSLLMELNSPSNLIQAARQEGIREVVEWLHSPCPHTGGLEEEQMYAEGCPKCWKAKLKEWGIEVTI